jgi:polysaccharide deacetylase family protein (PEP-CTERM system associated)
MNVLTVDVEEYFQVEAFSKYIEKKDWENYPFRVDEPTVRLLDILDSYRVKGTFFVLGWLAERNPDLVKKIFDAGHEIASHGYEHTMVTKMTPEGFRKDIRKSKQILENIMKSSVQGYRAPTFSIVEKTSWAYDILLDEGFHYSSSVFPTRHDRYGWPKFGFHPRIMARNGKDVLWEIPMSVGMIGPFRIPFGGGGYLRAYPLFLSKILVNNIVKRKQPLMVYVHPWELDEQLPRVSAPFFTRLRHYHGIYNMKNKMKYLLSEFKFNTMVHFLDFQKNSRFYS